MKKKKILMIIMISLIVVLIALAIIIPIIINKNIEKEKKALLKSTNNIAEVIKKQCNKEKESESEITYKYIIKNNKIDKKIKIDEVIPSSGVIEVDDECDVTLSIIYNDYNIVKKHNEKAKIIEDNKLENGTVVYYDPVLKNVCEKEAEGCMKWYTFNDKKNKNTINLLLDHNLVENVRWISLKDFESSKQEGETYSNILGGVTALKQLSELTLNWKDEARLLSVNDIEKIIGLKEIKLGSSDSYFFDSKLTKPLKNCYNGDTTSCNFGWLYDNTSLNCKEFGCLNNSSNETYGYWLSDANNKDVQKAWRVYFDGRVVSSNINDTSSGIRPVIEIQKSIIS